MTKILIADDNSLIRWALTSSFEKEGYCVDCAKDGNEVLSKLEEKKFDFIITDLIMPGTNGIELIDKIKNTINISRVIVITGSSSNEIERDLVEMCVLGLFYKPFNITDIISLIKLNISKLTWNGETEFGIAKSKNFLGTFY